MSAQDDGGFPLQRAFEHFWISPTTSWDRFFNPQVSFISYNSGDTEVENHVLEQAGSYGKQLGRIIDVLEILVARGLPADGALTAGEQARVRQFRELAQRVHAAVEDHRGAPKAGLGKSDVDRMIEGLRDLKSTNPSAFGPLLDQLRTFVGEQQRPNSKP